MATPLQLRCVFYLQYYRESFKLIVNILCGLVRNKSKPIFTRCKCIAFLYDRRSLSVSIYSLGLDLDDALLICISLPSIVVPKFLACDACSWFSNSTKAVPFSTLTISFVTTPNFSKCSFNTTLLAYLNHTTTD